MFAAGRTISIAVMLLVAGPAVAQVINGESSYGDSDLHQPPADTAPRKDKPNDAGRTPPHETPEQDEARV